MDHERIVASALPALEARNPPTYVVVHVDGRAPRVAPVTHRRLGAAAEHARRLGRTGASVVVVAREEKGPPAHARTVITVLDASAQVALATAS
jgi:hypothetical protein